MSIYRPPGYGSAPTVEEHEAAPQQERLRASVWIVRDWDIWPGTPAVATVWTDGDTLMSDYAFDHTLGADGPNRRGFLPVSSVHASAHWCLLHPVTCLPIELGTPPETEEIYNADGLHVGTWLGRAVAPRTERERLERGLAEAAVAEAYAEARRNASDGDPGEHLSFSHIAHTRGTRAAARALADHIIKETAR